MPRHEETSGNDLSDKRNFAKKGFLTNWDLSGRDLLAVNKKVNTTKPLMNAH